MSASLPFCNTQLIAGAPGYVVTSHLQALITAYCVLSAPSAWPEDYGPIAAQQGLGTYDFIVIGAGTAGSVVASRLSENPNINVLIIESGDNPPPESEIPALFLDTHRGPQIYEYQTKYNPNACLGTKTGTCYWPFANMMGGRSSIDHMYSFRGNREKFDSEWNLPTWSWKEVTKYYDLSQRYSSKRGHLVLNKFEQYEDCNIREMISNGFEELGVKRFSDVDSNNRVGYGYIKGPVQNGRRMGAGKTYLSVVKSRPNVHVIKNADVSRINLIGNKVQSVTFVYKGYQTMNVQVSREVILSAGVIGNPKLLMLSGIGPRQELERLNIPVLVDLPGVGQNLHDQLGVPVPFQIDKFKAKPKTETERQIDTFYYLSQNYGPLSSIGVLALLGFVSSRSDSPSVDFNLPQLFSQRNDSILKQYGKSVGYSEELMESIEQLNNDGHLLFTFMCLQNPKSRGYVQLQSNDYRQKMKVYANYFQNPVDLESVLRGFKFQMRMENTRAYRKARAEIVRLNTPCHRQFQFKSDDYWRCYIKYMVATMYSPGGTTKMGVDIDPTAVLDLRLKVRGVNGLRVVGSSVFPSPITSMNSLVMVGERLSAFIQEDYSL